MHEEFFSVVFFRGIGKLSLIQYGLLQTLCEYGDVKVGQARPMKEQCEQSKTWECAEGNGGI